MTKQDIKLFNSYELVNRQLLFKCERNDYAPYKTNRTLVTNTVGIDSIRKAKAFLKKYLSDQPYVLTEVIEK